MSGDMREVLIGRQKWETVLATGCGYQKIDRPGVDTLRTTSRAKSGSCYIGRTSQLKKRVWIEKSQKMIELLCGTKAIEKFLQDITGQKQAVSGFNVPSESSDVRVILLDPRSSQDQRPH